jgi:hypothetical protein
MARENQKDLEGNKTLSHNSFSILEDEDIVSRALEMGVNMGYNKLDKVCILKDIEKARQTLDRKVSTNMNLEELNKSDLALIVSLSWIEIR